MSRPVLSSLRVRLLLLVLLAVVPALGVILHSATQERRHAARNVRENAVRMTRFLAQDQAALIEGGHQLLTGLAHLPAVRRGDPDACLQLLSAVMDGFHRYLNLGIIRADGTLLCTGKPLPPGFSGELSPALAGAFRASVATRSFAVSDFSIGRVTGRPVIMLTFPVLGSGGEVRSVVFASLDLQWLNEEALGERVEEGAAVTVTDRRGTVLVRYPDPEGRIGKPLPEGPLRGALRARGEGTLTLAGADGVSYLHAFTPLHGAPGEVTGYVNVGIPMQAAYAQADRALRRNLLFLAVLAALALAAAWLGGDLFVVRRVSVLLAATERLKSGDLGARTGLSHAGGELGRLARAFDEMAGALERRAAEAERAEQVLREREEQLRHSQKMEAVGRLGGGIAHDFNNILTAIKAGAEVALMELPAESSAREDLLQINQAADRAAALIRQLLAFSRKQVLAPRVLDLNEVVAGTEKMLRRLIGTDVELVTVLDPSLSRVRADPGQLEQVIVNLVVNARDAMPLGGRLVIRTAEASPDTPPLHRFGRIPPGEYVMLSVSDTGTGMDAVTLERIFEPFFTTKEQGKGTGLGLSTVYGIVKQSGGHVRVESEPGRGATFRILLPRVAGEAEPWPESAAESADPRGGAETVLLVEDEAPVRALARRVLRASGYAVLEAENGEAALRALRRHRGRVHLLLTDVVMPGMSGCELARRVREARPDTRVLYMSGHWDQATLHLGDEGPGTVLLQKPFSVHSLAGGVRAALDAPPPATPAALQAS